MIVDNLLYNERNFCNLFQKPVLKQLKDHLKNTRPIKRKRGPRRKSAISDGNEAEIESSPPIQSC